MNTVYYCGNELVSEDRAVVRLIPKLQETFPEYAFIHLDPTEGIPEDSTLVILDTVIGIEEVTVFDSLYRFTVPPRFTVHDYDLLHDLQILVKLRKIESFYVIGVPANINDTHVANIIEVVKHVSSIPNLL